MEIGKSGPFCPDHYTTVFPVESRFLPGGGNENPPGGHTASGLYLYTGVNDKKIFQFKYERNIREARVFFYFFFF